MKKGEGGTMKKISILLISILLLSAFPIALAQDDMVVAEELEVSAGITPDSIFWGIDRSLERVRMAFTRGNENKAAYGLRIAEERLAELSEMGKQNKTVELNLAENEREQIINQVRIHAQGLVDEKRQHVIDMLSKHIERLRAVKEKVPEQAKSSLERNIEKAERMIERLKVFPGQVEE